MKASSVAPPDPKCSAAWAASPGCSTPPRLPAWTARCSPRPPDGVGTKVAIAQTLDIHDTIGFDLVRMNAWTTSSCGRRAVFDRPHRLHARSSPSGSRRSSAVSPEPASRPASRSSVARPPSTRPARPRQYDCAGAATRSSGTPTSSARPRPRGDVILGSPPRACTPTATPRPPRHRARRLGARSPGGRVRAHARRGVAHPNPGVCRGPHRPPP